MKLTVKLVPAADDPPIKSPLIQNELLNFRSELNDAGVRYSQRSIVFDSVEALGYPLGEFVIEFTVAMVPVLTTAVGGWFLSRKGRKIRMEFNGEVLEASSIKEMEKLIELYRSLRDERPRDPDFHRASTDPDSGR